MGSGDSAALTVAVIALVVSVVAAGFSGWQAVTEHLARTRQLPARWAITGVKTKWVIHNLGGSAGRDIVVEVAFPRASGDTRPPGSRRSVELGPIAPGTQSEIYWVGGPVPDPRVKWAPSDDGSGNMMRVDRDTDVAGARYIVGDTAMVTWIDYRGKPRRGKVKLR